MLTLKIQFLIISSDEYAPDTSQAWYLRTQYGDSLSADKTTGTHSLLCVRGNTPSPSFTDNGDGTITDNNTKLMWQKCTYGQTNDSACSGTPSGNGWIGALAICQNITVAGFSDWRLPNVKELASIVKNDTSSPAIDSTYFPNTLSERYRTSNTSIDEGHRDDSPYIHFDDGEFSYLYTKGQSIRNEDALLKQFIDISFLLLIVSKGKRMIDISL